MDDIVEIEDLAFCTSSTIVWSIFCLLQYFSLVSIGTISWIKGSFDVDIDERRISFALEWRSNKAGMSMILGWCRAEVVKHLGRFNQCFIFVRDTPCIFLMAASGIGSTAMVKLKEGHRYFLYIHSLDSPHICVWSRFSSFWLKSALYFSPASHEFDLIEED